MNLQSVWVTSRRPPVRLDCIQIQHDTPDAPLLPPDFIHNSSDISCDGTKRSKEYKDVAKARAEYNVLRGDKLSQHRHRKFVFGAIYENLFPGFLEIDPFMADYDVVIKLASGNESELKVRLVSPDDGHGNVNLLSAVVELGRSLSGPGNARGERVGDMGSMHAVGVKSVSSKEVYKTEENTAAKAEIASKVMREWLEDNMRSELGTIICKDVELNVEPPPSTAAGPGSRMMISVNLANSPHYDTGDSSISIGIWVEDKPGQSENWYFVLPNVSCNGSRGVVVKLMHGVVISWDGREIYHCTSKTKQGIANRTYGCMWTSATR